MNHDYENMTPAQLIRVGLEDGIAHARGQLNLNTVELPAPPAPMSAKRVTQLRKQLKMSQRVFAAHLNVSVKLVQSWEQGDRTPNGGCLRLLQIVRYQPRVLQIPSQSGQKATMRAAKGSRAI